MQNLKMESDERLIQLYEDGNDSAFDVLLDRHQQSLFAYILAIVHDEDQANDFFQETFFKAISYIRSHRYTDSGKFLPWLLRIARNLIIDSVRHSRPIVDVVSEDDSKGLQNMLSLSVGSVEANFHNEQTISDLAEMISRLPQNQQDVIRMRLYEDRPFKEIAEITNCSINTALGRMRYAILNLRKMAAKRDLTLIDN
ncbi:MAG: sigma-70 family RNA polymerase sigma factor [Bacteroidaceae bacterium]|jgi:RNA polymerase sigma-70 factor (ECF subfamily)|nr:sigma-70 family RNA polymerase sigma factor [Bacteroidaceae bacterium]